MAQDGKAIFIDTQDGQSYERQWGGISFSVLKLPDHSVKVKVADESQVCEKRNNQYGNYWVAKLFGGVGIISFKPSKKGEGDYCLFKLSEDVALPSNPSHKNKPVKPSKEKKSYTTAQVPW